MVTALRITSFIIVLIGLVHLFMGLPFKMNEESLWFAGSGLAVLFSGFVNIIALEKNSSSLSRGVAFAGNVVNSLMFYFACIIFKEPQVYFGFTIYLLATVGFSIIFFKRPH
jgi:hypothetical protein